MDLLLDEGDEIEGGDVWGVVMGRFRQGVGNRWVSLAQVSFVG